MVGTDGSSLIVDGWFMEKGALWPGQAMSLQVDEVLHHSQSAFQDILVFRSASYGHVLVLDGVIQCTQRDEFSYHEMIAHLPLFSHPAPADVLVIGGGDGGVLTQVIKHPAVRRVTLCEIDPAVSHVSRQFFPKLAEGLSHHKVHVVNEDGFRFLQRHVAQFDVVITDSSDPIGPAESLFQAPFYEALAASLRPDGVLCAQGECMWLHAHLIKSLLDACRQLLPVVRYAYTTIPTYPSGQIGFVIAAKNPDRDVSEPLRDPSDPMLSSLRYYNPAVHRAAFALPQFVKHQLALQ